MRSTTSFGAFKSSLCFLPLLERGLERKTFLRRVMDLQEYYNLVENSSLLYLGSAPNRFKKHTPLSNAPIDL